MGCAQVPGDDWTPGAAFCALPTGSVGAFGSTPITPPKKDPLPKCHRRQRQSLSCSIACRCFPRHISRRRSFFGGTTGAKPEAPMRPVGSAQNAAPRILAP
uniref:Uncharacterized protein n=1 Tax=Gopherus agassizii TaxID=38772 RepID=A0A452HTU5_9SAUR